jgi:hypothetical protein
MEYFELDNGNIINLSRALFIGKSPTFIGKSPTEEYIINLQWYGEFSISEDEFNRIKKRVKPKFVFSVSS